METIDLIDSELIRVRESLKLKSESELKELSKNALKREYDIFGKKYPLVAWSEEDPDGSINVVVEITKKMLFGSYKCFSHGFKHKDGKFTNLTVQELWEFD